MRVSNVLEQINQTKPNAFDKETLLTWLNRIESMVQTEALHVEPEEVVQYTLPEDLDTKLILDPPFDQCYELYIGAQIDLAQQEFATYQNTMTLFNQAYEEMLAYYVRKTHKQIRVKAKL